jgi:hypothetical protein
MAETIDGTLALGKPHAVRFLKLPPNFIESSLRIGTTPSNFQKPSNETNI